MPEFTLPKLPLENAMKLAVLSTESTEDSIASHCLFEITATSQELKVLATDKRNRLSMSKIAASTKEDIKFTVDPRKIVKLIKTIDTENISFCYVPESNTLQILVSDDKESVISLASFDPNTYAPIADNFEKSYNLKTINAGVFLGGFQFIRGFLDQKDKKFSNMYISKGVMYGSNGYNKAGAYSSDDMADMDDLVFPLVTFPAISILIETLDLSDIMLGTSSNHVFVSSPNKDFIFAFTKIQLKMPRIPINTDQPTSNGWLIERSQFLKKLERLQFSGNSKMGVQLEFKKDKVLLTTIADRSSRDSVPCSEINEFEEKKCVTECRALEGALKQIGGEKVEIYVKNKIVAYYKGEIEFLVKGEKVKKPFISAAGIALSKRDDEK